MKKHINIGKTKVILMSILLLIFMITLYNFGYNHAKNKLEINKSDIETLQAN